MKKRVVAVMLSISMMMGILAGCGNGDGAPAADAGGDAATGNVEADSVEEAPENVETAGGLALPLSDERKELNVVTQWESNLISDPNEIEGVQAMEERTNVHINYQCYGQTEMLEKFTMILNTGEYPDILFPAGPAVYPGGYEQGIKDGVLIDMHEYIDYMPNYKALLESNPEARKQAAYDDGKFHGIRVINGRDDGVAEPAPGFRIAYREDLLKKMGEDLPTTIDEWHDLFVKCRDAGMTAACTLEHDGGSPFSLAWEVMTDWSQRYMQYDQETQKIDFGPMTDGFGEYLETMRQWYAEGLIDKNFTAGNYIIIADYSNIENDQTMLLDLWFGNMTGSYMYDEGFVSNPDVYIKACPAPTLKEGDPVVGYSNNSLIEQEIYVTTACEDPVLAAKWLDYLYSEEGMKYRFYGIEGKSYTYDENGSLAYTDEILHPADGLSPSQALSHYAMGNYIGYWNFEAGEKLTVTDKNELVESGKIWSDVDKNIAVPRGVVLSAEEEEIINQYYTDIETLVQEHMVKYIIGQDDTTQEEFVEQLKQYGIEQILECYQNAADRYKSR